MGISVWEERVPFEVAEGGLAAYKTAKGTDGTGDKDEKSVNGTQISIGKFHWENGTTFSGIPFIPENFRWNEPKSRPSQPEFSEFFGKWKTLYVINIVAYPIIYRLIPSPFGLKFQLSFGCGRAKQKISADFVAYT